MGMRKISANDQETIIKLMRRWPLTRAFTWEELRKVLSAESGIALSAVWSRQSLSANEAIASGFKTSKVRVKVQQKEHSTRQKSDEELLQEIIKLRAEKKELIKRNENLLLRHTRLCFNVSLLSGGSELLFQPLPDNTINQGGGALAKKAARKL